MSWQRSAPTAQQEKSPWLQCFKTFFWESRRCAQSGVVGAGNLLLQVGRIVDVLDENQSRCTPRQLGPNFFGRHKKIWAVSKLGLSISRLTPRLGSAKRAQSHPHPARSHLKPAQAQFDGSCQSRPDCQCIYHLHLPEIIWNIKWTECTPYSVCVVRGVQSCQGSTFPLRTERCALPIVVAV